MKISLSPRLRYFLIISAKHAVNAILTNAGLMTLWSEVFNIHSPSGWVNLLKATALVVATRESMVWGPKIITWSMSVGGTDTEPLATEPAKDTK
jgi:hypothetical protein